MLPAHYYGGLLSEPHIARDVFCVLYLNKLVTGLKNVDGKWCEEKLDFGLSASILLFPFSWPQHCHVWEFSRRGRKEFQLLLAAAQKMKEVHVGLNPEAGINYTRSQTWNIILSLYKRLPRNNKTNLETDWIRKLAQFIFFHLDSQ